MSKCFKLSLLRLTPPLIWLTYGCYVISMYELQDEEYVLLSTRIMDIQNWVRKGNILCGVRDPSIFI
jgi:hypothetical protein